MSLVLHGAVVCLLLAWAGKRVPVPRGRGLTPIEVVDAARPSRSPANSPAASPPPARTPPAGRPSGSRLAAGVQGRREPTPHAQATAAPAVQSLASLQVRYGDPTSFANHGPAPQDGLAGGVGRSGIGAGLGDQLADGIGNLTIPEPPGAVSHRQPPRIKGRDMTNIPGASRFAGQVIEFRLSIDEHGRVRGVQVLRGVDPELDRKAARMVGTFEFEPALDDAGVAIASTPRWRFEIVEDDGSF